MNLYLPLPAPARLDLGEITPEIDEAIDRIDTELMKRGTLASDTVAWKDIRIDAEMILQSCLHLQAAKALILARAAQPDEAGMLEVLRFTERLFIGYWHNIHPQGAKHERRKKFWGEEILASLTHGLGIVDKNTRGVPKELLLKARELTGLATALSLKTDDYVQSCSELRERGDITKSVAAADDGVVSSPRELDARGRAELRRDIRSIADRIARHDPKDEISYLLRSYAAWLEFRRPPPSDEAGQIEQQPMPAMILDEFTAARERPSHAALVRLEDRLYMSPDWFEGHQIAADIGAALGFDAASKAILHRARNRFAAMPELGKLKYANGTAIISEGVRTWLKPPEAVLPATQNTASEQDEFHRSEGLEEPIGFQAKLSALEAHINDSASERAKALAKLALARLFLEEGMPHHGKMLLNELHLTLQEERIKLWDTEFFDLVEEEITGLL